MEGLLAQFDRACDHRAAFLRVYAHMSRRVLKRMEAPAFFLDPTWLERVALRFADMYFDAHAAYEQGRRGRSEAPCPPAWRLAFSCAEERQTFLLAAGGEAERAEVLAWIEQDALAVGETLLALGAPGWARKAAGTARRLRLF